MSRHLTLLLCAFALVAGCSRNPERSTAASPTAPSVAGPGSLLGPTSVAPGGVSGKYDVSFPGRNDSFDFRNQLETKYQTSLGRSAAATFVDREGEVVWTQEYMRYRVNGCDHGSATQRVLAQIDGNAPGQVCGAPQDGLIAFPPRNEAFDFRRQLESRYQQFNRGFSSSTVDAEGGVIWTQEYLRYRVNACDHPTAVQKVFSQIDGGGVAATCYVPPCIFTVAPNRQGVSAGGGSFTVVVNKTSGENCTYTAESLADWVSITGGITGSTTPSNVTYNVAPNFGGGARSTFIRVRWTNNSTLLEINQDGFANSFVMVDPFAGPGETGTCMIRSTATPCQFSAPSSSGLTYAWTATYSNGVTKTFTQTGSNPNFSFSETCGGPVATVGGFETPLSVTLTVTDSNGNSTTATSGTGAQPALIIKLYTC